MTQPRGAFLFGIFALVAVISVSAQTRSAQPLSRGQSRTPTATVQRASWSEGIESSFGISRDDFKAMGLSKLTPDEYGKLLTWDFRRVSDATEKGKELGKEQAKFTQTYSCGRSAQDEASATRIALLVHASSGTPSEITSGVNQRLRSMSDIEIVYDAKDVDLTVAIIGYANELENNNRRIGYIVSTVTSSPCVGKFGSKDWNFESTSNHYLNSGPNVQSVIEQIVAALDANDFEDARKEHASFKKLIKQEKQP